MKVAVVGAQGFVGRHILRALRDAGIPARSIVRRAHATPDPDRKIADALDVYALRAAFAGCDCIVHAVLGDSSVILGSLAPVYAAAEAVGAKRLIYISTGSVHGQSPARDTDETSPLHTHHAFWYNNAKVRAERRLRQLRARGSVEIVLLRPTIVFGPGSRWVFDFGYGLRDHTAYVVDAAQGICNSIYVDNLAYAVQLSLTAPGADGETFLVGDAETVTWADLYRALANGLGYDFDRVPSYSPPELVPTFRQRVVDPLRASDLTRAVVRRVPRHAKDAVKSVLRRGRAALRAAPVDLPPPPDSAARTQPGTEPRIPAEIAALHRCRWRLPNDKAARILGYAPPVSFAEGCRRSVEWMSAQLHTR